MEIDFTRLKYFLAVAEELHFTRAADRLSITPPPLSKQIRLLERELGGALFERQYHEVRLTPLGQTLVEPVRRILAQVDDLKATADRVTKHASPLRVGATAYAPSDFLEAFELIVAGLPDVTTVFDIAGSAAEVTAQLIAGTLDLGLIHLPAMDERIGYRVIGRYPGGVAVRSDDPLADKSMVTVADLRDRQIIVDFAKPNPLILADLIRRLNSRGVTQIVHGTATGRGSEIEMAAQARNRHLVVLVAYAPLSTVARVFSPPEFTLLPIDETSWEGSSLALAWSFERRRQRPQLGSIIEEISTAFHDG